MSDAIGRGNAEAMAAIAAITGQSVPNATEMFCVIIESDPDKTLADDGDVGKAVDRLCTRIRLAPALAQPPG